MKKELNYLISGKEEILIELQNFSISPRFIQKVQKVKQYLHIDVSGFPCPSSYCFKNKSLIGVDNILVTSRFTFLPPSTICRLGYKDFLGQVISFPGKRAFITSNRVSTIEDLIASEKEEIELLKSNSTVINSSYPCYYFLVTSKLSKEYEIRKFYYDTEDPWFMGSLIGELVDKFSMTKGILIDYD